MISRIPKPLRRIARRVLRAAGLTLMSGADLNPAEGFHSSGYWRHSQRRLEHLASLGLPIAGSSVLEVAAGIGDHTSFFLDRGCSIMCTDGRPENVELIRKRYAHLPLEVCQLDLDDPADLARQFDIVYCYGALYHLQRPSEALAFMARCCRKMLLLETCVSLGDHEALNPVAEPSGNPTQSVTGRGCRPTRRWVYAQLRLHFEHVYIPRTQPNDQDFLLDWTIAPPSGADTRSVFIASRQPLGNPLLIEELLQKQIRQG